MSIMNLTYQRGKKPLISIIRHSSRIKGRRKETVVKRRNEKGESGKGKGRRERRRKGMAGQDKAKEWHMDSNGHIKHRHRRPPPPEVS